MSTRNTYTTGQHCFITFSSSIQRCPILTTESTLLLFVAHLATAGLSHSTIKVYLAAVHYLHTTCGRHKGFLDQLTPRLQQVLKGIKKTQSALQVPRVRRPITLDIMRGIQSVISTHPGSYFHMMIWAACCLAFFGFLRSSEFTVQQQGIYDKTANLSLEDIALDSRSSPMMIRVNIKQSKTDPFRQGVFIYLGKTESSVCPVKAIIPYLAIRGYLQNPYFCCKMIECSLVRFLAQPLIPFSQKCTWTKETLIHSFRIGAATSAINAGITDAQVKILGRWRSDAYQRYVKTTPSELAKLSKKLAAGARTVTPHLFTNYTQDSTRAAPRNTSLSNRHAVCIVELITLHHILKHKTQISLMYNV